MLLASEFGAGLAEKQKLRFIYGLLERQFRKIFAAAKRERGVTGERFLQLLETRLDSVVYLLGFASLAVAAIATVLLGWPPVLALLLALAATMAYAWSAWRRARRSIPQDWPRWRAERGARRHPPS